jgi:hypothetical protein
MSYADAGETWQEGGSWDTGYDAETGNYSTEVAEYGYDENTYTSDPVWGQDGGMIGNYADDYTAVTPIGDVVSEQPEAVGRVSVNASRFMKYSKQLDSATAQQHAELEEWRYRKEQQRSQRANAAVRFTEAQEDLMFGLKISTKQDPKISDARGRGPETGIKIDQKQFLTAHHMELFPEDEFAIKKAPDPEPEDEGPSVPVIPLSRCMYLAHLVCCCFFSKDDQGAIEPLESTVEDGELIDLGVAGEEAGEAAGEEGLIEDSSLLGKICSCCLNQPTKIVSASAENEESADYPSVEEGQDVYYSGG